MLVIAFAEASRKKANYKFKTHAAAKTCSCLHMHHKAGSEQRLPNWKIKNSPTVPLCCHPSYAGCPSSPHPTSQLMPQASGKSGCRTGCNAACMSLLRAVQRCTMDFSCKRALATAQCQTLAAKSHLHGAELLRSIIPLTKILPLIEETSKSLSL